jgi:putative two-component system response regulator
MRVLVVDDDPLMLRLHQKVVARLGHEVTTAMNGHEALRLLRHGVYRLLLCDWEMPQMNGLELCRRVRQRYCSSYVYIIMLTARTGTQNIIDGLNAGADEFISKPVTPEELCVRIRTGERILALESREVTVLSLAKLAQSHDQETGAHVDRMREYCRVLAETLSERDKFRDQVDGDFVHLIYLTSPLHDIGKVGIPDCILQKAGPWTDDEYEIMKQHAVTGGMTLDSAIYAYPDAQFLCMARDIARSHHERFDGSGYPHGLCGEAIPLCGRIVALADVYDALTTRRVYKPAVSHRNARRIILAGNATQFDPDVVQAFLDSEARFVDIYHRYAAREEKEARLLQPRTDLALSC